MGNFDLDVCDEETVVSASNDNNELTVHEEKKADPDFLFDKYLDDVSVVDSVDDFDFSSKNACVFLKCKNCLLFYLDDFQTP